MEEADEGPIRRVAEAMTNENQGRSLALKTPVINHPSPCVASLCLLFAIQLRAAQFVELTAEIETVDWHSEAVSRQPSWTVRCVVGTNAWRIDGRFVRQGNSTWSFTGTNLVERTVISDASGTQ